MWSVFTVAAAVAGENILSRSLRRAEGTIECAEGKESPVRGTFMLRVTHFPSCWSSPFHHVTLLSGCSWLRIKPSYHLPVCPREGLGAGGNGEERI